MVRFFDLFVWIIPFASAQFFTPITKRQLWRVGEVQKITYNTKLTNYTIALWQQALAGGAATLGPTLFQTTDGPGTEFEWTVQLYDFELASSNVFFFWLREGPRSLQGKSGPNMSSAYFNITDQPLPSTSSKKTTVTTTSTVASTQSSTSLSTQFSTTEEQSSSATTEGTKASQAPSESQTTQPATTQSSGGLPVGAQAGIGVGVGIIALTCIICAVMWVRHLKKQLHALQQGASQPPSAAEAPKMQVAQPYPTEYYYQAPVELGSDGPAFELGTPPPVEIGSSGTPTWNRVK